MESPEQDIKKYARLILRKKGLFFAVAASIMAVFVMAGYLLPKTYEATVYGAYCRKVFTTNMSKALPSRHPASKASAVFPLPLKAKA